jgi:hypothetical protein
MTATVPVTLLVGSHLLTGSVAISERRLLDLLNSEASEYLTVDDAHIYNTSAADSLETDSPLARLPHALVAKGSIHLVIITAEAKNEPREAREDMYVEKQACAAFVALPGVALRGTVHIPYSPYPVTPESFMARDADRFFPMTDAEIIAGLAGLRVQGESARVAMIRTAAIEVCSLDIPARDWRLD